MSTKTATQREQIAGLRKENAVLRAQLRFMAELAGCGGELDEIRRQADLMNPASPVPDPPQAPPSQSTEEALASGGTEHSGPWPRGTGHTEDDPSRPGTTPGSVTNVPAAQTTTAITPGVEIQTPPATDLCDVTAPVTGTNPSQDGGVPISQRRIETDVRIDPDPLKAHGPGIGGQGNDGTAFPWMIAAREREGQAPAQANGAIRTMASMRLGRLRVQAGLASGDDLEVGAGIERDAALSTHDIEREIEVLSEMARRRPAPMDRAVQRRTAARSAPSMASAPAPLAYATAASMDEAEAFDIFLD